MDSSWVTAQAIFSLSSRRPLRGARFAILLIADQARFFRRESAIRQLGAIGGNRRQIGFSPC
jgi:hypothetical protein